MCDTLNENLDPWSFMTFCWTRMSQIGVSFNWGRKSWRHRPSQVSAIVCWHSNLGLPCSRENHKKIMSCHNLPDRRSNSHKQTVSRTASFFANSRESGAMIAVPTFDGQHLMPGANTFSAKYKTFLIRPSFTGRAKFSRGILNGYESHLMPIVHCTVVEENC